MLDVPNSFDMCPQNLQSVCFIKNNPYSNTYNPSWLNHPNFPWGSNQHQAEQQSTRLANRGGPPSFHHGQQRQNQLQRKAKQVSSSSSPLEALLKEYMQKNDALVRMEASSIRILELHMGQIVGELKNRQRGSLASNTEAPRNAGKSNKE